MAKGQLLRSFIAIELPEEVKDKLIVFRDTIKQDIRGHEVKWVNINNIHLTIKFLGEAEWETIQKIGDNFEQKPNEFPSPNLIISKIGMFPNKYQPKILWVGCSKPAELVNIYTAFNKICAPLNFPIEKRSFSPHLTIGRVKPNPSLNTVHNIQSGFFKYESIEFGNFTANQVIIFHSDLKPSGPVYSPVRIIHLNQ